jgi:hypothetical protein
VKDPNEVLDYSIDWSDQLTADADTIDTSTFSVVSGDVAIAVSPAASISDAVTTVWLTGGTVGTSAVILNRIVTVGGRTWDQSVRLRIRSK